MPNIVCCCSDCLTWWKSERQLKIAPLDALGVVSKHRHARRDEVLEDVDLGFASQRWQSFVAKRRLKSGTLDRRALEVCVFPYLADALQTGDLYVVGAENFADLMGLTISASDHTTVSRRPVTLPVIQAPSVPHGPLHVLIDSTGLQVYGAGQWLEAKHGAKSRRTWRNYIWRLIPPAA